ncbi:MAG: peptide/nickel transport system substrate-binding protein, partial [Pseudonocardiales bacterium]|nr:peptide/nickel transport system substrate-binding protein [Pseudonocardiales bacterium]
FVLPNLNVANGIALAPFEGYWAGPSKLSGVDVRFVPDGTNRGTALRAGEVDVAVALPLSGLADTVVEQVRLPRTVSLVLNTSRAPFAQPAARLAAQEAVDPAALARGVFHGRADVARGLFRSAPPWLITPSGASGRGLKVVLATYDDRAELPEVASAVAESLRGSGFQVEQVVRKYSQLEPDLLAGNFDAVVMSRPYVLDDGDPAAYLAGDFTCSGGSNLARLCDPVVDNAVAAALATYDVSSRRAAAVRAQNRLLATNAVIPLVHERAFIGHSPRVDGLATDPYERLLITRATTLR